MTTPNPVFAHLLRLTDHRGTYEHALLTERRREHGYCTDDMARVLVVATREPETPGPVNGLAGKAIQFLNDAQSHNGACRNRMSNAGNWTDQPTTVEPGQPAAMRLLTDYVATLAPPTGDDEWPWPEPRLTYANAVLPEAMIAAGVALENSALTRRGLDLLEWLLDYETANGHLSPTPVGGRGPLDERPAFDQQPIEVAALADACARAAAVDPRPLWVEAISSCAAWFLGDNDAGQVMWDPDTGGGFDGLLIDGVNLNQGAESTLAVISTLQHARRFSTVPQ
jgi:hypothetical protein